MKKKMRRLWRQVTADKKKFGILVTVFAVGLLLWGRLILLEDVPKIATATDPTTEGQPAQADPGAAPPPAPEAAPQIQALPEVQTRLRDRLALDLFAFRYDRYNRIPQEETPPITVEDPDPAVDEDVRRRELQEDLVEHHELQSVILGDRPRIVVNGRLYRVGDSFDGFEIVSFTDRSATLTRDGLTFRLEMSTN